MESDDHVMLREAETKRKKLPINIPIVQMPSSAEFSQIMHGGLVSVASDSREVSVSPLPSLPSSAALTLACLGNLTINGF